MFHLKHILICLVLVLVLSGCKAQQERIARQERMIAYYEEIYNYINNFCEVPEDVKGVIEKNLQAMKSDLERMQRE